MYKLLLASTLTFSLCILVLLTNAQAQSSYETTSMKSKCASAIEADRNAFCKDRPGEKYCSQCQGFCRGSRACNGTQPPADCSGAGDSPCAKYCGDGSVPEPACPTKAVA